MISDTRVPKHKLPCAYHLSRQSVGMCVVCRHGVCNACHTHEPRGRLVCAACRRLLVLSHGPAWERPQRAWMTALSETTVQVIRHPSAFFPRLPPQTSPLAGWIFGSMFMAMGMMLCVIWETTLSPMPQPRLVGPTPDHLQSVQNMALFLRVPLLPPMLLLIHATTLWGALRLSGARAQWGQVLRVCGYASVAYLLCVVPHIAGFPLGVFLALVAQNNLIFKGLHALYDIPLVRAWRLSLIPLLIHGGLFFL